MIFPKSLLNLILISLSSFLSSCLWIQGKITRTEFGSSGSTTQQKVLGIYPSNAVVLISTTQQFTASDSSATFSIVGASLGCSITSAGLLTAGASVGSITVRATLGTITTDTTVKIYSPLGASLLVWLKADSLALADGANVAAWSDSSGNGNNMTGGGTPPVYKTNILNSQPVVRFNGTSSTMTSTFFPVTGANPRSITAVVINGVGPSSATPDGSIILGWGDSFFNGLYYGISLFPRSASVRRGPTISINHHDWWNGWMSTSSGIEADATPTLVTATNDGTTDLIYINGRLAGQQAVVPSTAAGSNFHLGYFAPGVPGYYQGDIAEVLIHNTALSSTEVSNLSCYLGLKYNISLQSTNPCAGSTPRNEPTGAQTAKINSTLSLQVAGGTLPYTYSATRGSVSTSGVYTAPSTTGADTITVTDAQALTLTISVTVIDFPRPLIWLKPEALSTYADTQTIFRWLDSSGNNNHAWDYTIANRPTYRTNQINGYAVARFSGAHGLTTSASFSATVTPRSLVAVVKNSSASAGYNVIAHSGTNFFGNDSMMLAADTANTGFFGIRLSSFNYVSSTTAVTAAATLLLATFDGVTTQSIFINGTAAQTASNAFSTATASELGGIVIGRRDLPGPDNFYNGDIAEFMAIESDLTVTERTALETYLKTKYAIP